MNEDAGPQLDALERSDLGLSEVTRLVTELEALSRPVETTTFGLSGNVTVDLLGTYLRRQALLRGSRAAIRTGSFGDHLGNIRRFATEGVDAVILLDLFDAVLPAFEAQAQELGGVEVDRQADRYRSELALTLGQAQGIGHVFLVRPHRLSPPEPGAPDAVDAAVSLFDEVVTDEASRYGNVHLVSGAAISARLGWSRAHDMRSYQRFRAPFTPAFMDALAASIYDATRAFGSYFYKALVLDCDGTLWGGILGEDLADGIKLDPFSYPGSMFWRMQHEFLALERRGVILCLCSKNDGSQVDQVFATHPAMVLRDEHLAAKRVNWDDKVTNLESLAAELNIGLDAMIFLDDSTFECESVRSRLPMVTTIQVPSDLSRYPEIAADLRRLFAVDWGSNETPSKTEQYRIRRHASEQRERFATQEEYLASLEMRVTLGRNERASASRIAELTQKSNQFNLTTRRYEVGDIDTLMASADTDVYSIHVADRFGDSGLTGVVITRDDDDALAVDAFLMSCRVLGRGVEWSFWERIRRDALARGRRTIAAEYLPTAKNGQVSAFWDQLGLERVAEDPTGRREYRSRLDSVILATPPVQIEVTDGS